METGDVAIHMLKKSSMFTSISNYVEMKMREEKAARKR
jgi:hypothetical protein